MTMLRIIVGLFIAHAIGFGVAIWCTVEMEAQNTSQVTHGLQVLVAYDVVVTILLIVLLVWAGVQAHRKTVFVADDPLPPSSADSEVVVEVDSPRAERGGK